MKLIIAAATLISSITAAKLSASEDYLAPQCNILSPELPPPKSYVPIPSDCQTYKKKSIRKTVTECEFAINPEYLSEYEQACSQMDGELVELNMKLTSPDSLSSYMYENLPRCVTQSCSSQAVISAVEETMEDINSDKSRLIQDLALPLLKDVEEILPKPFETYARVSDLSLVSHTQKWNEHEIEEKAWTKKDEKVLKTVKDTFTGEAAKKDVNNLVIENGRRCELVLSEIQCEILENGMPSGIACDDLAQIECTPSDSSTEFSAQYTLKYGNQGSKMIILSEEKTFAIANGFPVNIDAAEPIMQGVTKEFIIERSVRPCSQEKKQVMADFVAEMKVVGYVEGRGSRKERRCSASDTYFYEPVDDPDE